MFPLLLGVLDAEGLKTAVCVCRYLLLLNWLLVYNLLHTARMCIKVSVITVVGLNELSVLEASERRGGFVQHVGAAVPCHPVSSGTGI